MAYMRGEYIFGDITTGRLFHCNLGEMLATDDGVRTNVAPIHEVQIVFDGVARRLFDIIKDGYRAKGGNIPGQALPGAADATAVQDPDGIPYGGGRADVRLAMPADGELYVLSKSDGMIRRLVAVIDPPTIQSLTLSDGVATVTWPSISNRQYRVQFSDGSPADTWTNLPGDITATNSTASKTDNPAGPTHLYRVISLP
jgi:hypothetical protein